MSKLNKDQMEQIIWNCQSKELNASCKMVLLAFTKDLKDGRTNTNREDISRQTGLSMNSVHIIIQRLVKTGFLRQEEAGFRGNPGSYSLNEKLLLA